MVSIICGRAVKNSSVLRKIIKIEALFSDLKKYGYSILQTLTIYKRDGKKEEIMYQQIRRMKQEYSTEAAKYYPDEAMIEEEMERVGKAVSVYEITIEHLSGKEIQER